LRDFIHKKIRRLSPPFFYLDLVAGCGLILLVGALPEGGIFLSLDVLEGLGALTFFPAITSSI
jgi:hypothetical protein